jgi:predicted DNA-binding transcriptional regulator YafY
MNRIDRLTAILIQLQSNRVTTARQIAERFRISLRTVYRDIRALELAGVPIGAEAGIGYFLAKGYHLPPVMFSKDEAGALLLGGKLIEKFSDMGVNQHFCGAMDKIKVALGGNHQDHLNRLDTLVAVLKITPPKPEGLSNNLLIDIQSILSQSQVIRIDYHSGYKDELTARIVEPLGLCYYAGNWHLLAYCRLRRDYRDFRVDRIKAVEITAERFNRNRYECLDDLVRHIVMAADLKSATIVFTRQAARVICDQKYYFGFVRQCEREDGVEMEFLVPEYHYLGCWLLSFVDQVWVKQPASLVQTMAGLVKRLGAHYSDPG